MSNMSNARTVSAQTQPLKIVCKVCNDDLTNGWRRKVGSKLVVESDPMLHVRYKHLSDEFDNWYITLGQQPPSEDSFLEVTF